MIAGSDGISKAFETPEENGFLAMPNLRHPSLGSLAPCDALFS
jgi:hypothetical protein